nr:retrovirus-related Pol polyprotein from transposon TNT 1-94 [Tanacetum cinerariifolium]
MIELKSHVLMAGILALGVVRLSLTKNLASNVVNEKTTVGLLKALSNMYEKPSASNKVFLIKHLVKMTEGATVSNYALLLLSSLPDSWSDTVIAVSSTSCTNKMTFKDIRDMILGEDIRRRKFGEYPNSLLSATSHGRKSNRGRSGSRKKSPSENTRNITCWNYGQNRHIKSQCEAAKVAVNVFVDVSDDALLCCVEEYCESWVIDLGASFHAIPCMGMIKNFNWLFEKVRLADMKVLDVAGIGDVVLKISFGTEWIMKNVRYLLSLKRRLISVGQLDDEWYHIGFDDQIWKVTRRSRVRKPNEVSKLVGAWGASGSYVNRLSLSVYTDLRSTLSPIECLKWCSLDARMIAVIVRELDQRLILDGKETLALERESRSKLNKDLVHALDELRCLYLHKVKECDSLAQKLSKQIKSVSKAVHTELLQHLKAQLRDKNIAISELKKLIEKGKGKSMKTKFDKPSVVRQPNAQRIPKPSVLVTAQTLPQTAKQAVSNTNVLKPRMYRINNRPTQTRAPQLPQTVRNTNPHVSTSIGVNHKPNVSRPRHKSNQSRDKVLPNNSQVKVKKTQVEVHPRIPSVSNKMKSVTVCKDSLYSRTLNANDVCATCNKCLVDYNHFACVTKMPNDVNARTKKPNVVPISTRKPKSQANKSVATPHKKKIVQLILFIVDSGCMKHMTGNLNLLCNFVEKFLCTVYFGNDQFAPILGYGKLVQGNVTINRVYYVEGLNHNLFSIGQFCDADLEVAFRKSTCFVKDLQGNDLLTGNRRSDLYTISLQELTSSIPFYLMAKASPTQAWLWHQRLSHLNFDYINLLLKKDVVIGLPKLKYVKDQLCSSCELSKAKRSSFKLKFVPSSKRRLNLLHMDSCGLMQKKEKDKTVTKPDENGKRGRARQCKSPVTVKKAEKEKKYRLKGPILENPKSVFNSS